MKVSKTEVIDIEGMRKAYSEGQSVSPESFIILTHKVAELMYHILILLKRDLSNWPEGDTSAMRANALVGLTAILEHFDAAESFMAKESFN